MQKSKATLAIGIAAGALILTACSGGSSDGGSASGDSSASGTTAPSGEGQPGGTLTILNPAEQILSLDPQVVYTGEDIAFLSATIQRSLTAYQVAPGDAEGTTLVPDMATDTGTVSGGGTTWEFTIRDGVTWENGNPVTCEDVAYGVSRQFDIGLTEGGPVYAVSVTSTFLPMTRAIRPMPDRPMARVRNCLTRRSPVKATRSPSISTRRCPTSTTP